MMRNDTYAGYPSFGAMAWEGEPQYPPLWDEATHQAVIRERARRRRAPSNYPVSNPYTGCMVCARCGEPMYACGNEYYRCSSHARSYRGTMPPCHANYIPRSRITAAIVADLERLSTPENLDALVAELDTGPNTAQLQAQIAEHQGSIEDLHTERQRIATAYRKQVMDDDIYRSQDDDIKRQIDAHEQRIADLQRQIAAVPDLAHWRAQMETLAADFPAIVATVEAEVVAAELQRAGLVVLVEENEVCGISWRA
jgi:hypothetical protein